MAVSPNIPTSFVPKQPLDTPRRKQSGGSNLFFLVALIILGVSAATAGAVFGYQKYLESVVELKGAELKKAEAEINRDTVEEYLRLERRFNSARSLLAGHTGLSQFMRALEEATLKNVRYDQLMLTVAEDRSAKVELDGSARNFNTLAAQSNAIAADKRFKRAIFSGIAIEQNTTVSFTLTADLASELVVMQPPSVSEAPIEEAPVEETPAAAPEATTTEPVAPTGL